MYQRNQLAMVHTVIYFLLKEKTVKWKSFIGDLFLIHHFPSPLAAKPVQYSNDSLSKSLPCVNYSLRSIFSMDYHTLFPWIPRNGSEATWRGLTSSEHPFPHTRADLNKWQFSDLVEIQTFRANMMSQAWKRHLSGSLMTVVQPPGPQQRQRTSSHKQSSDRLMCTMAWWHVLLWLSMTHQGKCHCFPTG